MQFYLEILEICGPGVFVSWGLGVVSSVWTTKECDVWECMEQGVQVRETDDYGVKVNVVNGLWCFGCVSAAGWS